MIENLTYFDRFDRFYSISAGRRHLGRLMITHALALAQSPFAIV